VVANIPVPVWGCRRWLVIGLAAGWGVATQTSWARAVEEGGRSSRHHFRTELSKTVRADHPFIVPIADGIRQLTVDPLEQLVVVEHVTKLLVEYDSDRRVYQRADYHATLDEMIARARAERWAYLRDDCDGRAVFAAHLLGALNLPWRLEGSYWKGHAWVSTEVAGVRYDLLDLRPSDPELQRTGYQLVGRILTRRSRPPPPFAWRQAWLVRAHGDLALGRRLGLIETSQSWPQAEERFVVNHVRAGRVGVERSRGEMGGSPE
jgi:hypothetical protein